MPPVRWPGIHQAGARRRPYLGRIPRPGSAHRRPRTPATAGSECDAGTHPPLGRRTPARGKKNADIVTLIEFLLEYDTAGDPITGLKWSRRTTAKVAMALSDFGVLVSPSTVARLLHQMGYSLRVNHKKLSTDHSPIATISSSTSAICATDFSAVVSPSLAWIPKNANWSAISKISGRAGTCLPAWSTITTSAPILLASPSLTASMICLPIEAPSWSASP